MKIADLFSGCGGFSTGFEMENFKTEFAIEFDNWAQETYSHNHKNTESYLGDIRDFNAEEFKKYNIDGIIGGPPCQGFSLSGKRDKKDPRNSLFMDYLRFVKTLKPKFFIMENVTGLLSMKTGKGVKVINLILKEIDDLGYNHKTITLNAADFGVPQTRKRVFIIGIREDLDFDPEKLTPKKINEGKWLTIEDAISDLPFIESGEKYEGKYKNKPSNDYQKFMRVDSQGITNNAAMRHTQRVIDRFKHIKQGQSLADVPEEHMQRQRGDANKISGKVYSQNNMRGYWDRPSATVTASFQGNFVHPKLNRNYTAREAARLQSFPDRYEFKGKRTTMSWEKNLSQYQQIGNAVPPLLGRALAKMMKDYFK